MKHFFPILILLVTIILLNGCKNESNTNRTIIQDSLPEHNDVIASDKELNEDNIAPERSVLLFQPTIENPASLFEGLKLSKSYKSFYFHNPIMTHRFGADPFAMVYEDRIYVYSTHDILEKDNNGTVIKNSYGMINSLNCISSDDMVNWTDHGTIPVGGIHGVTKWANNSWAPAATFKTIDGQDKFFIYFANSANSIGVLTSDSPIGPFTDPLGKPLITRETPNCSDITWLFDPAVLVDDDGKAYLYFGGGVPKGKEELPNTGRVVLLGEDMISLAGTPAVVEAPYFFEAAYINKIGETYYYSYCSNWSNRDNAVGPYKPDIANIIYMTSRSPMGPWEYQGSILQNPGNFFGSYGNNHHSLVEFKEKWYIFYHSQLLQDAQGITGGYRSIHVDEVTMTEDGVIAPITATKSGVKQIKAVNPYEYNEAESIAWSSDIATQPVDEESKRYGSINRVVTDMVPGSYIGISQVDFGQKGCKTFTAKVSSNHTGNLLKICIDGLDREGIAYFEVPNTKNLETFVELSIDVKNVTGIHDLFFVFTGDGFQFDSWRFNQ